MKPMMKTTIKILFTLGIILALHGCSGMEDIYEKYVVYGGRVYPQKATDPQGCSGDSRAVIKWKKGVDSSVIKAIVSWDDGKNSKEFDINSHAEEVELLLTNLEERDYSFSIRTCDAQGNKSIPVEVNTRAYGETYKSSLYNRTIGLAYLNDENGLVVEWNEADVTSGIVRSELTYTNTLGTSVTKVIEADEKAPFIIKDYKLDTKFVHQSFFVPDTTCIDTFTGTKEEELPLTIIDRSNWTAEASSYEDNAQLPAGGPADFVLDGNKLTFWHTAHDPVQVGPPHWIAVDMKRPILIKRIMLQGRNDGNGQDLMFDHFKVQVRNSDTEEWMDLDEFDVPNRGDRGMQYYPVVTKKYYSQMRIYVEKTFEFFCGLSEVAILGLEEEN